MAKYLEFQTKDERTVLVEIDSNNKQISKSEESDVSSGLSKVGLTDIASKAISKTKTLFEDAITSALHSNVELFYTAINTLPNPPSDIEINFALKVVGEVGNVAIGKLNTESNYSIKLTWRSNIQTAR